MFTIDALLYEELLGYCDLLGLPGMSEAEARRRESDTYDDAARTSSHEAGHVFCYLLDRVRFVRAEVGDGSDGARGWTVSRPPRGERPAVTCMPPLETRIALEIAGAVGEEVALGDVDPIGVWTDLRVALARATDAAEARQQVARVRGMLRTRRDALLELATALKRAHSLTSAECASVVRAAGVHVNGATFDPVSPAAERERCDAARADVVAQRDARRPAQFG
jgi:hypothetical protein